MRAARTPIVASWRSNSGSTGCLGAIRPSATICAAKTSAQARVSASPSAVVLEAFDQGAESTVIPTNASSTPMVAGNAGRLRNTASSISGTSTTRVPVRKPLRDAVVRCRPSVCSRNPIASRMPTKTPSRRLRSCARPFGETAMKPRSSAVAIPIRTATSTSGEATPSPSSERRIAKLLPQTAMISVSARSANEEEPQAEHRVDREQERSFQPVRLPIQGDQGDRDYRDPERDHLEARESEIHRHAQQDADEYQDGRDQEGNLLRRFPGDPQRHVHVAPVREEERGGMLGGVPNDGDDHHAHERLRQVQGGDGAVERVDQKLAGDGGGGGGHQQPAQVGPDRALV